MAFFWAAAPKGTKSCRTQGDFRLFVHPPFIYDLRLERADLKPKRPERAYLRPERADLRLERDDLRPDRTD